MKTNRYENARPIYDGLCDAEKELDILEKYRNKVKEFLGETE